jgi:5-methylcytosine-specific restriction protein A
LSKPRLTTLKPRLDTSNPGGWKPDAMRGTRQQRGYGPPWEKTRKRIRARANDTCEPHLAMGIVHLGCQCDHKLAKSQGGTDDEENLHWVCEAFHEAKTRIESRGEFANIEAIARDTAGGG